MNKLNEIVLAGNELWRIGSFTFSIAVALLVAKQIRNGCLKKKTTCQQKDQIVWATTFDALAKSILPLLLFSTLSFAIALLKIPEAGKSIVQTVIHITMTLSVGYTFYCLIAVPCEYWSKKAESSESKMDDMLVPIVQRSLRITLVVLVFVQLAQYLSNKPITSILAGLGIGGLAIALASQETIKNLFGSIMIMTDHPFELGDRIVIDGFDGPVKEVGLRSTKIETLEGHLVTIPNARLADKTIQNIGKREFIRRILNLTLPSDTPSHKVEKALSILRALLKDHEGMKDPFEPRVYFNDISSDGLNIIIIYWYHPPAYWDFLKFSEWFNMEIVKKFHEEGIDFALPSSRTFLAADKIRPLSFQKDSTHPTGLNQN